MIQDPTGWTLWSRTGYRGPAHLRPPQTNVERAIAQQKALAGTGVPRASATSPAPAERRQFRVEDERPQQLVDQIIDGRVVHIEYQPVYDSARRQIVAFEALSRGPEGPLRSPVDLFAAAQAVGRLGELDWVCRAAAFRDLLDAKLPSSISLFVNVEADSLIEPCPPDLLDTVLEAEQLLRVVIEVNGRSIARHPVQFLVTARRARAA